MDIITRINWIDILVIIVVVRIGYVALQEGLSHEIFSLISAVLTAAISMRYFHGLSLFIQNSIKISVPILDSLVLLLLVLGCGLIFKLARFLVNMLLKVTWHPAIEKFGGLFLGLARAVVIVSLLLTIMALMPLGYLQYSIKDKSLSGPYLLKVAPEISSWIAWVFPR